MAELRKKAIFLLCAVMLITTMPTVRVKAEGNTGKSIIFQVISFDNDYGKYIAQYKNKQRPEKEIIIPAEEYKNSNSNMINIKSNDAGKYIEIGDEGQVEWEIEIEEEGLYNIGFKYMPIPGKSSDIERELLINGKIPFDEAKKVIFSRMWKDKTEVLKDNQGNDIRPSQIESPKWAEMVVKDFEELYKEPLQFYFSKGSHTISLNAVREPVAIQYIKLYQEKTLPKYEHVKKGYTTLNEKFMLKENVRIQGESAVLKSDPTLYPLFDRDSSYNDPFTYSKIRVNNIGGYNWRRSGQWLEWKVNVPESGLYKIGMRYKQNYVIGLPVTRRLEIDGKVPFEEANTLEFQHDTKWQFDSLKNKNKEEYLFYLTKGEHTIRMSVSLGEVSEIIRTIQEVTMDLTQLYTKIIMITGANPDKFRDYQLEKKIKELIPVLTENAEILREQVKELKTIAGSKVSEAVVLERTALQLESMVKNPETIPERLGRFRENLSGLASWILMVREQPLNIDYLVLAPKDNKFEKALENVFDKMVFSVRSFITSFMVDFTSIGNKYDKNKSINVWIATGRDQANTIKSMIDDTFTPETGINVNLNLINNENVILFSISSGKGPDVALNVSRTLPVDYGIRNALVDLSRMTGFNDVKKLYKNTAITPYSYNGKVYGIPQTQSFPMLFYRKDILQRLGVEVPQTWEEVYEVIGKVEENNLQFCPGLGLDLYNSLLLQNEGQYYTDDLKKAALDSVEGIETFKQWTNLYTLYGLPLPDSFDFFNRFRTGEMPIGIFDYTIYNAFTVAAPQIKGLWDMAPIPGTPDGNGGIDRSVSGNGTANVIFNSSNSVENSWKFLKWWTSTDTQVRYGRELEALMGSAARYNTANVEAMKSLPWPKKDYDMLNEQWSHVNEIPIIPGSYYSGRHIDNAFRETVLQGEIPRDAIIKYVKEINKEISKKREEFNLDK
jgi:ABC-type glycerol-3-phosphate transport system substrate-binding protein